MTDHLPAPPGAQLPPPPGRPAPPARLASEKVVIQSPLSFAGSGARIWKLTRLTSNGAGRVGLILVALVLLAIAWLFVAVWTIVFGILLIPYRLIRRGGRKRKRDDLRHREMLEATRR